MSCEIHSSNPTLVLFSDSLEIELVHHRGFTSFQKLHHYPSLSLYDIVKQSFLQRWYTHEWSDRRCQREFGSMDIHFLLYSLTPSMSKDTMLMYYKEWIYDCLLLTISIYSMGACLTGRIRNQTDSLKPTVTPVNSYDPKRPQISTRFTNTHFVQISLSLQIKSCKTRIISNFNEPLSSTEQTVNLAHVRSSFLSQLIIDTCTTIS
ncbi:hypothetical protein BLNAU_6679 [Blattamonas nauphoetae]|uniref:Uncharacterized protein n=1 Tax=Blattamonas nauphoetae TaxID=2049346 RepID=A0ABQ9Y3X6_9EUKA|nr:hypothetical protein BLNAU_6679 [Blattamonas nauphoetae]